jgi:general secretion pathway protein C
MPLLSHKSISAAVTIVILGLITAAAYMVVRGGYRLLNAKLTTPPPATVARNAEPPLESQVPRPLKNYDAIEKRNLFSVKPETAATPNKQVTQTPLKPTKLNLTLWGTVTGPPERAVAIIQDGKTRQQQIVHEGDQIQRATVKAIQRERIVLTVNGRDEILEIEKSSQKGRRMPNYAGPGPGVIAEDQPPPPPPPEAEGDSVVRLSRSRVEDAMKNVNELMRQARVMPHFSDGQPDGLRLSGVRPGSLFTDIGLRSGDIITGVNGEQIQSVDDALRFYTSLREADNVNVQIRRGGTERSIEYRIE